MNTPVEYYYGETLRWSFGFDNPNKAAVIFACLVPLLWWLWQRCWRVNRVWLKVPGLVASAALLLGTWYCLSMTFSRGGLVAAACGLGYAIASGSDRKFVTWRSGRTWHFGIEGWFSLVLLVGLAACTWGTGLGARSAEVLAGDASVGNRIELWRGALQMAVENPAGFGRGTSGQHYMNWYQPTEREEGYRTMVNSYLTFLVEQGWARFVLALVAATMFWVWTRPLAEQRLPAPLWGCVIAFAVAGIFSTTMEESRLWILPAAAALGLAAHAMLTKRVPEKRMMFGGGAVVVALAACLAIVGWVEAASDPLAREFARQDDAAKVVAIGPKTSDASTIGCLIDSRIVGDQPSKLLRGLALNAGVRLLLGEGAMEADRILCMGASVHRCADLKVKRLWLLAPEETEEKAARAILAEHDAVSLLMPEIDEDGRVDFWDSFSAEAREAVYLTGVGNRVDWAWAEVVAALKEG